MVLAFVEYLMVDSQIPLALFFFESNVMEMAYIRGTARGNIYNTPSHKNQSPRREK